MAFLCWKLHISFLDQSDTLGTLELLLEGENTNMAFRVQFTLQICPTYANISRKYLNKHSYYTSVAIDDLTIWNEKLNYSHVQTLANVSGLILCTVQEQPVKT